MDNTATCRSCRHWEQSPENHEVGTCAVLGILLWPPRDAPDGNPLGMATQDEIDEGARLLRAKAGIMMRESWEVGAVSSDVSAVQTMADFGCVRHRD